MKVLFNNQKVASTLQTLKKKIRRAKLPIVNGSIVSVIVGKGKEVQYKVTLSTFNQKRSKSTISNVRYALL